MRLFLYGSLRDPSVLAARAGEPSLRTRCRAAVLSGWRRAYVPRSRYPTLIRAPGEVAGIIAEVGAPALRRLQAYEGATYRLMPVTVRTSEGARAARAWVAAGGR